MSLAISYRRSVLAPSEPSTLHGHFAHKKQPLPMTLQEAHVYEPTVVQRGGGSFSSERCPWTPERFPEPLSFILNQVAVALIGDPQVVYLDEPTTGCVTRCLSLSPSLCSSLSFSVSFFLSLSLSLSLALAYRLSGCRWLSRTAVQYLRPPNPQPYMGTSLIRNNPSL